MENLEAKDTFFLKNFSLNIKGKLMDLSIPRVMGILNLSPDSFYDGGRYTTTENIKVQIEKMTHEGMDIIDIGSVSTRPGAMRISTSEEYKRLVPALKIIRKNYPDLPVSIDTSNTAVAEKMIREFDIDMINDITAGGESCEMFDIIAKYKIPYIIMHMQGEPSTMQRNPEYTEIVNEILRYLAEKAGRLKAMGINDIIIDPGFGFGKTIDHNYELLSFLECFKMLELPILVGFSRKSMIYKLLGQDPSYALNGTTALNMIALAKGANILRVHDVREAVEVCKLYSSLSKFTDRMYH